MGKPRGLGRGLSALIPERVGDGSVAEGGGAVSDSEGSASLPVLAIDPNPYQPRRTFSESDISELAQSIRVHGVIQPIVVRRVGERYQLVAGERRVRAAKMAGLEEIPALVKVLTDRDAMEMALVENLQRSDLNPIEESMAYQKLIAEFQWTQEEIGARVGKSRSHVANLLRLLQLDERIQGWIGQQLLTVAHAKILLSVDEAKRWRLAERAVQEGWTVKQLQAAAERGEMPKPAPRGEDVHLKTVETALRRRFGTKVTVRGDAHKGRIEIPYRSLEELERLLAMLEDEPPPSGGFVV